MYGNVALLDWLAHPSFAIIPVVADADPGDAGWGDVIFVSIWAIASLLLAAFYCYRAFFTAR